MSKPFSIPKYSISAAIVGAGATKIANRNKTAKTSSPEQIININIDGNELHMKKISTVLNGYPHDEYEPASPRSKKEIEKVRKLYNATPNYNKQLTRHAMFQELGRMSDNPYGIAFSEDMEEFKEGMHRLISLPDDELPSTKDPQLTVGIKKVDELNGVYSKVVYNKNTNSVITAMLTTPEEDSYVRKVVTLQNPHSSSNNPS